MADIPLSISTITNALKYWYLDGLRYQLNEKASAFLAQIKRTTEHVEGYKIKAALSYGVTGGIGNRADDAALPTTNPRKFLQAEFDTKNAFARILLTDKTISASKSARGAFITALEHELQAAENDSKRDYSRQIMSDGTGLLATITAVSSDGTVRTCTLDSAKWFYEGMLIDVYTSGGSKDTSEVEVTSVDRDAGTIVFTATHAPVATDLIYLAGNKDLELTGVKKVMTADNTIYGIDRTSYKWFNPTVKAVNGEISEVKIQEGIDDVEDETGAVVDFLIAEKGVKRSYINLLSSTKQIVNKIDLQGGHRAISFNGLPLIGDRYCTNGELLGLVLDTWKLCEMDDWDWLNQGGEILIRVSGYAKWEASLKKYADLLCNHPRANVRFTGITRH
jgi:hypothetical protein